MPVAVVTAAMVLDAAVFSTSQIYPKFYPLPNLLTRINEF